MKKAAYRLIDPGYKPGQVKRLEMLVEGEWQDISAVRRVGMGSNYRLRWIDHCLQFYPPYKPIQPLTTHYDKDGNVIDT